MNIYTFGQCTWWCANQEPWCMRYGNLNNALDWAANWRKHGGFVQMTPVVGTIACFQPGSNDADAVFGHVAVVIAVSGNNFRVSERNGPAGPSRTDDRGCTNGPGVSYLVENAPTPPPKPIEEDPRMYTIINFGAPGIYLLYDDHVLVGVYSPTDVTQLLSLPQCHGERTLDAAMLARFQAVAPKGTP